MIIIVGFLVIFGLSFVAFVGTWLWRAVIVLGLALVLGLVSWGTVSDTVRSRPLRQVVASLQDARKAFTSFACDPDVVSPAKDTTASSGEPGFGACVARWVGVLGQLGKEDGKGDQGVSYQDSVPLRQATDSQ